MRRTRREQIPCALKSSLTPQSRIATISISARGFGGRGASVNSPRQLEEVIQCLLQTLVRSQVCVYWLERFVDHELAPAVRLRRWAQAFVTRATDVTNGRMLRCSCRAVTLSA